MLNHPSSVTGVAEIVLNVSDIEKMSAFYQEVLGFAFHSDYCMPGDDDPREDDRPTIVFLVIGNSPTPLSRGNHPQLLALIDPARHLLARGKFTGVEVKTSTLNHLAFEIARSDHELEKTRIEALGLEPRVVTFPDMAARALFFDDPEGNTLELICHDPDLMP